MRKLNTTVALATEHTIISFAQAKELMKDLVEEAGYNSTAKDLFNLLSGGRNGVYEKLVFQIKDETPITHFSIQKLGNCFTIWMAKENRCETSGKKATTLINLIENFKPSDEQIAMDTAKGRNLEILINALDKAEKSKGKNAKIQEVFAFLYPQLRMGNGRCVHHTPHFKITFNAFLSTMTADIEDINGFKTSVALARDLRKLLK